MRAWLYYRLSRDEDEELNSLTNQRSIIAGYYKTSLTRLSEGMASSKSMLGRIDSFFASMLA